MEKILKTTLVDGTFKNVNPLRSRLMKSVKGRGNKSTELKFRLALVRAKISGWKMHPKLKGSPDIIFPKLKIIIYLDGCFWHCCPECGHIPKTNSLYWKTKFNRNIERDKKNNDFFASQGYQVIRFWEHELIENINNCVAYIDDAIEKTYVSSIFNDYYAHVGGREADIEHYNLSGSFFL